MWINNKKSKAIFCFSLILVNLILAFNYHPIFNDKSNVKIGTDDHQINEYDESNED